MTRTPEPSIPEDEALYRSIAKEHIADGIGVLPTAVEVPACSFNRSRYSAPDDVVVVSRPTENGIIEITPRELPPPVPRAEAAPYEFFAADDPIEGNDAHCEIRLRRTGTAYSESHKPSREVRVKARDALARKLRVRRAPT